MFVISGADGLIRVFRVDEAQWFYFLLIYKYEILKKLIMTQIKSFKVDSISSLIVSLSVNFVHQSNP